MGFSRAAKRYKLVFETEEWDGFEVTMKALAAGDLLAVVRKAVAVKNLDISSDDGISDAAGEVDDLFRTVAGGLVSWNLEDDDGNPVPATPAGVMAQDFDLILAVVGAWTAAQSSVPPPLQNGSPSGASYPEASIPMGALSPSHPS